MLLSMPHVDKDMKSAEQECGVYWRPIPTRQCADYRPRPPVYEHPPPQWTSYEPQPTQQRAPFYEHQSHHWPSYEYSSQHHPITYEYPPPQRPNYEHHVTPAWTEWPHHPPQSFAYHHRAPPPMQPRHPEEQFVYHQSALSPPALPPPPPTVDLIYEVSDSDVLCGKSTGVAYVSVSTL
jgi:hypothetical protein